MAIQKLKAFSTGVDGNYWRVLGVSVECMPQTPMKLVVLVGCYVSKAARNANKTILSHETYEFEVENRAFREVNDPIEAAYVQLKTLAFFSDGVDV